MVNAVYKRAKRAEAQIQRFSQMEGFYNRLEVIISQKEEKIQQWADHFESMEQRAIRAEKRVLDLEAELIKSRKDSKTSSDLYHGERKKVQDLEGKALERSMEICFLKESIT